MSKHKLKRSSKDSGYYTQQFAVTAKNKARRAASRQRRKTNSLRRQMLQRLPK